MSIQTDLAAVLALIAELDRTTPSWRMYPVTDDINPLSDTESAALRLIDTHAAEIQAMARDAERYRFLRDVAWHSESSVLMEPCQHLDQAIDAAMLAASPSPEST